MPPLFSPSRRSLLRGCALGALAAAAAALEAKGGQSASAESSTPKMSSLTEPSEACRATIGEDVSVPPGYKAEIVIGWCDRLDAPGTATPASVTPEEQARCFGTNNDFLCVLPRPNANELLLFVNHESPETALMFSAERLRQDPLVCAKVEMASVGASFVLLKRNAEGGFRYVPGAPFNRRLTAETPCALSGPAAGHARLRTSADPEGLTVAGTFGNCSGGVTPWGTVLTAEENVDDFFLLPKGTEGPEAVKAAAFGASAKPKHGWHVADKRFDLSKEPNELNRFGWIVEVDPNAPEAKPRKLTALGRFKHEGALVTLASDGRVSVFMGDDEAFMCLYRFTSHGKYDPAASKEVSRRLLDEGTLSAARFHEDGTLEWLDLTHGTKPLTPARGFPEPADALIDCRAAAKALGATPMDRPEGIARCPRTGYLYVSLSKNAARKSPAPGNPRPFNRHGHILRLKQEGGDPAAKTGRWEVAFYGGAGGQSHAVPDREEQQADPLTVLSCPDNLAFDKDGVMWICTDGMEEASGVNDGVYRMNPQSRPARAKRFLTVPRGAEATGPAFSRGGDVFFLSVQHPARGSTFDDPQNRWPDHDPANPPRSAVIAVRKLPA